MVWPRRIEHRARHLKGYQARRFLKALKPNQKVHCCEVDGFTETVAEELTAKLEKIVSEEDLVWLNYDRYIGEPEMQLSSVVHCAMNYNYPLSEDVILIYEHVSGVCDSDEERAEILAYAPTVK